MPNVRVSTDKKIFDKTKKTFIVIAMKNMIACRIHNNSLGRCLAVSDEEAGKATLKEWAEEQFGRPLTNDEKESLENSLEIYNDEDPDNIYTFSLGIVE